MFNSTELELISILSEDHLKKLETLIDTQDECLSRQSNKIVASMIIGIIDKCSQMYGHDTPQTQDLHNVD